MYRFFAILKTAHQHESAKELQLLARRLTWGQRTWSVAFNAGGLTVLHSGARAPAFQPYYPAAGQGVVLGKLFRHQAFAADEGDETAIQRQDQPELPLSSGPDLIQQYWGRYVALLARGGQWQILRDPTGALPCYFLIQGEEVIIFSHLDDLLRVRPLPLSTDWQHVVAYLRFRRVIGVSTGLAGVRQVLAGQCVTLDGPSPSAVMLWHPRSVCDSGVIHDVVSAQRQLRRAVRSSVHNWISCHDRILHELSGGVDSAIVLACIATARRVQDVVCFNMFTSDASTDERPLARLAARQAGCELVKTPFTNTRRSLEDMLGDEIVASPLSLTLASEVEDARRETALSRSVGAIYSGQGGDNVLQRRRGIFIATEYLQRRGLRPSFQRIVLQTARMTGQSFGTALAQALKDHYGPASYDPYGVLRSSSTFLSRQAEELADADFIRHPWVTESSHLPAGKIQQVFDIVDTQAFFCYGCHYADIVHPLISQPIIECVLRIPTYLLTCGGRERGLFRRAFQAEVPSPILERTSKGDATAFYYDLIVSNLPFLRGFLLDGVLVKEGLLDRARVELELSHSQLLQRPSLQSILTSAMAESWVRRTSAARIRSP